MHTSTCFFYQPAVAHAALANVFGLWLASEHHPRHGRSLHGDVIHQKRRVHPVRRPHRHFQLGRMGATRLTRQRALLRRYVTTTATAATTAAAATAITTATTAAASAPRKHERNELVSSVGPAAVGQRVASTAGAACPGRGSQGGRIQGPIKRGKLIVHEAHAVGAKERVDGFELLLGDAEGSTAAPLKRRRRRGQGTNQGGWNKRRSVAVLVC